VSVEAKWGKLSSIKSLPSSTNPALSEVLAHLALFNPYAPLALRSLIPRHRASSVSVGPVLGRK